MSQNSVCSKCGKPLPANAPEGLCPHCLVRSMFGKRHAVRTDGSPPPLPEINRRVGDYELIQEIGRGGMGVVYRARQASVGRMVALKMMLLGRVAGEKAKQRVRNEAQIAGRLQHPNIVAIYDAGEQDGTPFIAMEYVEGRTLDQMAKGGSVKPGEAAELIRTLAVAIHYAHRQGVVHRDLKPSNVMIDTMHRPRITDFGMAKHLESDLGLTGSGDIFGTPSFMSPEQVGGARGKIGPATDVYSLGGILYFLLSRRPPFCADTRDDVLHQVVHDDPVAPRRLNPSIPLDLQTICLKCLEKNSNRRYNTAEDLADDLGRFLRKEPIRAKPASLGIKLRRWCQRQPRVAALLGSLLLVSVLAVFFFLAAMGGVVVNMQRAERNAAEQKRLREIAEEALRQYEGLNASYRACGVFRFQLPPGLQPIIGDAHDMLKAVIEERGAVADIGAVKEAHRKYLTQSMGASAQSYDFKSVFAESKIRDIAMFDSSNHDCVILFLSFQTSATSLEKLQNELQARLDQTRRNSLGDGDISAVEIDNRPAIRDKMKAPNRVGSGQNYYFVFPEDPTTIHNFSVFILSDAYDERPITDFIRTMRIVPRRAR